MKPRAVLLVPFLLVGFPALVWALHPWPILLRWKDPSTSAYIEYRVRQAAEAGTPLDVRHQWVSLEEIPGDLIRAVTVAEDDRFREHRGVDWAALAEEVRYRGQLPPRLMERQDREALREAWRYVRENREQVRGRSTLTQQLARNLYLSPDRSMIRKGQELLIARRLEFFLDKDRILELYLNLAELGPGIFGVEAASQAYFQRPVQDLSRTQAASLAATLPHPLTSNPGTSPGRMAWRRDLILNRMAGGTRAVPPPELPDPVEILPPELPEILPLPDLEPPAQDTLEPPPPDTFPEDPPDPAGPDTIDPDTISPESVPPDATPPTGEGGPRSDPSGDRRPSRAGEVSDPDPGRLPEPLGRPAGSWLAGAR